MLTGPDGLLKQLTKTVIETALNQELTEHLGHDKHGQPVAGNVRAIFLFWIIRTICNNRAIKGRPFH